uniref:Uncharacterized protein n=1 Tax=Anguilla anguilla TaxID=7936 RepID=A0A0E9RHD5_ANGAN
MFHCCYYR